MASTNLDEISVRPIGVPDFSRGINTSLPPTEIADNEVQDLLNFEFDDGGNITTRRGVTELFSTTFNNRITSLHYFTNEATGEIGVVYTTGTQVRLVETNGTGDTNLTGALTLPSDTFWSWVTFNGIAIGANKATSGDNPIKVTSAPAAAALGGSPPKAKYLEVWENRLWIVSAAEPNQLRASALGNPEDWTTTGAAGTITIDVDTDDGDQITGIFATRGALYVFKRRSIHRIVPLALPATDPTNLKREVVTRKLGCVSHYSISQVIDDVLFLSDGGVASLTLAATAEEFKNAYYSRNIKEITAFPKTTEEIPALLCDTVAQYWLSIPTAISPSGAPVAYVMDYLRLNDSQPFVRWTRFDGMVAGTAYTSFNASTGRVYLIGALNAAGTYQIFKYLPRDDGVAFSDDAGTAYNKSVTTKAFNADVQLVRKFWHRWALSLLPLNTLGQLTVQYFFDDTISKTDSYSFNFAGITGGSFWDSALWDTGIWDSAATRPVDIVRDFKSTNFGREAQDVTFVFTNSQDSQGFTIRDFAVWYSPLTDRRVTEV